MTELWSRLKIGSGDTRVLASGLAVAELVRRLEEGEDPSSLAREQGLTAVDLVAGLGYSVLGDASSEALTLVQARPARPALAGAFLEERWAPLLPSSTRAGRLSLLAGLFQIFDFWEPSHEAAQRADDLGESTDAPYWHGIAHRREPDASNAAYWFRRVGRHDIFPKLVEAARPLLSTIEDSSGVGRLIRGGSWDPFGFIDVCTRIGTGDGGSGLARRLQRLELILLLDATLRRVLGSSGFSSTQPGTGNGPKAGG